MPDINERYVDAASLHVFRKYMAQLPAHEREAILKGNLTDEQALAAVAFVRRELAAMLGQTQS